MINDNQDNTGENTMFDIPKFTYNEENWNDNKVMQLVVLGFALLILRRLVPELDIPIRVLMAINLMAQLYFMDEQSRRFMLACIAWFIPLGLLAKAEVHLWLSVLYSILFWITLLMVSLLRDVLSLRLSKS